MTENPNPSNKSKKPKPSDIERIAHFMTAYLGVEMLEDIPCPEHLQKDYDDLDKDGKREWFEYTFHEVFKDAAFNVFGLLGRQLSVVELNLIKRRIVDFFKKAGIEYEK